MPVITIGRQFGAGGRSVGSMLAERLKADVLDSQLIDQVAHRLQLPKEEVEAEELAGDVTVRLGEINQDLALLAEVFASLIKVKRRKSPSPDSVNAKKLYNKMTLVTFVSNAVLVTLPEGSTRDLTVMGKF